MNFWLTVLRLFLLVSLLPHFLGAHDCRHSIETLTGERPLSDGRRIVDRSVNLRSSEGRTLSLAFIEGFAKSLGAFTERQTWSEKIVVTEASAGSIQLTNLIVRLTPVDANLPTLVIGAHYDSINSDSVEWLDHRNFYRATPGADDNASGVAGVLELLERLKNVKSSYNLEFVFFDAEEPGIAGEYVGSKFYVRKLLERDRAKRVKAAIVLDMIGLPPANQPQEYGLHVYKIKPRFLSTSSISDSPFRPCVRKFGDENFIPYSDHNSFIEAAIPSAFFCGLNSFDHLPDHYHRDKDRIEMINFEYQASIISHAERLIRELMIAPRDPMAVIRSNP